MFPAASFFALKTHLEPMVLAPGGTSSSLQVPAIFSVATPPADWPLRQLQVSRETGAGTACGRHLHSSNSRSVHDHWIDSTLRYRA